MVLLKTQPSRPFGSLNLDPLLSFLDAGHGYQTYQGHGPWMVDAWHNYRDNGVWPVADTWYYNAGSWYQAYKLTEHLGSPDTRFLDYADAEARFMAQAIELGNVAEYEVMTRGLYLMYGHDPSAYATFPAAIQRAGRVTNNRGFQDYGNSDVTRPVSRRVDLGRDDYRIRGYAGAHYEDTGLTNDPGTRYHRCMRWLGVYHQPRNHTYEWLDEWQTVPGYTNSLEYCHDVPNPPTGRPYHSEHVAFMHGFNNDARIYAYLEDPTYMGDPALRDDIMRLLDFDFDNGWNPPTGIPGTEDQYGAYTERYYNCWAPTGKPSGICDPQTVYGLRHPDPRFDTSLLQLTSLAFGWLMTGDPKYIVRGDQLYQGFSQNDTKRSFYFSANGGKQWNQQLYGLWFYLWARGDLPRWY